MIYRAGTLDRMIAVQRASVSYSNTGEPVEGWTTLAQKWSALRPVVGTEVNAAQQWVAREQVEFTIRWARDVADLSPLDRVVFPASDASSSPENPRSVYDIISVHDVGRNDALRILGARRVG